MSKKTKANIPFQVKVKPDVRDRILKIAEDRGLSGNAVAGMALAAGIPKVLEGFEKMAETEKQAA